MDLFTKKTLFQKRLLRDYLFTPNMKDPCKGAVPHLEEVCRPSSNPEWHDKGAAYALITLGLTLIFGTLEYLAI